MATGQAVMVGFIGGMEHMHRENLVVVGMCSIGRFRWQGMGTESLKVGRNLVLEYMQRTFGSSQYAQQQQI